MAITVTESRFWRIEDVSFNDAFVAPRITTPLSRHSYRYASAFGSQVPAVAFTVRPTFAVPVIVGFFVAFGAVPLATGEVGAEAAVPEGWPASLAVTVTVSFLPIIAAGIRYDAP